MNDAVLLRRYAQERSEEAFAELVRRHADLVYSAAVRQVGGDSHAAEDVTQAVFTELSKHAGKLTRHPALTGWLYTTTRRMASHSVRNDQRRLRREQEAQAMQELLNDSTPQPDWNRIGPVLDEVMHELSEKDRLAVLLRYFERRDLRAVGSTLGLSDDAARMRVERALEKLRALLRKRGLTSTTSALAALLAGQAVSAAPAGLAATATTAVLSTAVASTSTLGLLEFMASTKIKLGLATLIAAGIATPFVLQHRAMNQLHAENTGLRVQLAGFQTAPLENQTTNSFDPDEVSRLRGEHAELMRLRGEVAQLRRQSQEWTARFNRQSSNDLQTAAAELQASEAKSIMEKTNIFLPIPTQSELSVATPEGALQTVLWAIQAGDGELYQKSTYPEQGSNDWGKKEVERKYELLRGLKGVRVTRKSGGQDNLELRFAYEWETAPPLKNSPEYGFIGLRLIGDEWKVSSWGDTIGLPPESP